MGGKAKSIYLTILPKGSHVSVFKKLFFEVFEKPKITFNKIGVVKWSIENGVLNEIR